MAALSPPALSARRPRFENRTWGTRTRGSAAGEREDGEVAREALRWEAKAAARQSVW